MAALVVLTFAIVSSIDSNKHITDEKHKAPTAFLIIAAALLVISLFAGR